MDHFRPHKNPKFEGYYVRFMLPSGASLVLVMCSVAKSQDRPANIALAYVPPGNGKVWSVELWPESIIPRRSQTSKDDFELITTFHATKPNEDPQAPVCRMAVTGSTVSYELQTKDFYVSARATNHTPWSAEHASPGPEGWLAHLPLPLHWHVLSVSSTSSITIRLPPAANLDPRDAQPDQHCTAHIEKNWAVSFPSAHVWVQALQHNSAATSASPTISQPDTADSKNATNTSQNAVLTNKETSVLSLAGGKTLGLHAYLISYRTAATATTPPINLVFRPPFTLALPQFLRSHRRADHSHHLLPALPTPFLSCAVSWPRSANDDNDANIANTDRKDHIHPPSITLTATKPLRGWRLEVHAEMPQPAPSAHNNSSHSNNNKNAHSAKDDSTRNPSTSGTAAQTDDLSEPEPAPAPAAALQQHGLYTFSAPHARGFRDAWMAQSVRGTVAVRVLRRRRALFGRWEVVWEETMRRAGVEFGGEYFPLRGQVGG